MMAGTPKKRARRVAGDLGRPKPTSGVPSSAMAKAKGTDLTSGVWSEDTAKRIVGFVKGGAYVETAVRAAGVGKTTFYAWLKKGAQGIAPYDQFTKDVEKAMGTAEVRLVLTIEKAALQDWRAAAWKLERMHPNRYGPTLSVGSDMPAPPDAGMDFSALSMEQLRQLKYLMAKARGQLPEEVIDVESDDD